MEEPDVASVISDLERSLSGRYHIISPIAIGGMAEVYLATDLRHDRSVVLKVMRPDWAGQTASQRFLREIAIAAKLSHPNVVPLYDSGQVGSFLYYVMPYVEGESLRQRMKTEGKLPLEQALQFTLEIADALTYAHSHGIVHRDIKPENILIESDHALVADFGIAKAIEAAAGETVTTGRVAVGTLAYMSPEQASGSGIVDARSDVYSLALVLYEMITGEVPFRGPSAESIFARKAIGKYVPLRKLRDSVPDHLDHVVARALQPDPADRFQKISEFVSALRTLAPPGQLRRAPDNLFAKLGLAALVLIGTGVVLTERTHSDASELPGLGRVVVAPFENRTGLASLDVVGLMAGDWITEGLQKTGIVEVVPTPTSFQASEFLSDKRGARPNHEPMSALATETGAGTVVGGAVYRRGDRLLFRVIVADRNGMRVIGSLTDVEAPIADPISGVQEVRNRLMGWLALKYDDRIAVPGESNAQPPDYDAYRAFSEGMARYIAVDNSNALTLFLDAFKRDSSFTVALLYASISLTNLGRWSRADSLLQQVNARRGRLSAYDQDWLDYRLAFVHGNHELALTAIRAAAKKAPMSKAAYNHAVEAYLSGHVREALSALEALPPDKGAMRGFSPYWDIYGAVLHSLQLYAREYDVGRAALKLYPDRLTRYSLLVRAQVARAQLTDLASTMREAQRVGADPMGWDYGHTLAEAAEELSAHGHPRESREYFQQLRAWLRANDRGPPSKLRLVKVLCALGNLDEAAKALAELRRADTSNTEYLGLTGLLFSKSGRRAPALAIMDTLAMRRVPYGFGMASLYRARIAASLGLNDVAVVALRDAFSQGRSYDMTLHRDPDLQPLRGYPPFEEILRGKD
ncbi:MAG: protein kinase [Gemmatimonadota bacterium]|nr:protein kinase [Gemmatimonadota bacterium]